MRSPGTRASISIWLLPHHDDARPLRRLMSRLRDALGGPSFPPHVTLLSVRAHADAASIAARIDEPVAIELTGVDFGRTVHQSLYAPVQPSVPLERARRVAAVATGARLGSPWMPHVSLHYGVLDAASRAVARAVLADAPLPIVLRATRVAAWATSGPAEGWRRLSEAPLSS
jgi:hypothetical protein